MEEFPLYFLLTSLYTFDESRNELHCGDDNFFFPFWEFPCLRVTKIDETRCLKMQVLEVT